jgi:hypothetical protein
MLNIHELSAGEGTCCTEKNTIQEKGGVLVNRLLGSFNIIIFQHFVKRFETELERSGAFVVIGLYYFVALQGGRRSGKVLWLPNKTCQQ